jgi:hypothetical protein
MKRKKPINFDYIKKIEPLTDNQERLFNSYEDGKHLVAYGSSGTGKTFITVNLAFVAGESLYIDCDVEEPNGHLFLKPEIQEVEKKYRIIKDQKYKFRSFRLYRSILCFKLNIIYLIGLLYQIYLLGVYLLITNVF